MAPRKSGAGSSEELVEIKAPDFRMAEFNIVGTAPYVQLRFTEKAKAKMIADMSEGSGKKRGKKVQEPRIFEGEFEGAMYQATDGWRGIPAASFRCAMIAACRVSGMVMTQAKLLVFIEEDGFDDVDGVPLVKIAGSPERFDYYVRNSNGGCDIRVRAKWQEWSAKLRVKYDASFITLQSVTNLLVRAGLQVGVGEGRPFSRMSAGMGWGTFKVK
jgi:hypothetical protein